MQPVDRVLAPAKLTRSLRVLGVPPDGYHLLETEMVSLDLADELEIEEGGDGPRGARRGRLERGRRCGRRPAVRAFARRGGGRERRGLRRCPVRRGQPRRSGPRRRRPAGAGEAAQAHPGRGRPRRRILRRGCRSALGGRAGPGDGSPPRRRRALLRPRGQGARGRDRRHGRAARLRGLHGRARDARPQRGHAGGLPRLGRPRRTPRGATATTSSRPRSLSSRAFCGGGSSSRAWRASGPVSREAAAAGTSSPLRRRRASSVLRSKRPCWRRGRGRWWPSRRARPGSDRDHLAAIIPSRRDGNPWRRDGNCGRSTGLLGGLLLAGGASLPASALQHLLVLLLAHPLAALLYQ